MTKEEREKIEDELMISIKNISNSYLSTKEKRRMEIILARLYNWRETKSRKRMEYLISFDVPFLLRVIEKNIPLITRLQSQMRAVREENTMFNKTYWNIREVLEPSSDIPDCVFPRLGVDDQPDKEKIKKIENILNGANGMF